MLHAQEPAEQGVLALAAAPCHTKSHLVCDTANQVCTWHEINENAFTAFFFDVSVSAVPESVGTGNIIITCKNFEHTGPAAPSSCRYLAATRCCAQTYAGERGMTL